MDHLNYRPNSKDYAEYTFVALRKCATPIQPYQRASSGTQDKYNGGYGVRGARIAIRTEDEAELELELHVDKETVTPGETVTLTIDFTADDGKVGAPESGSPAVITAAIPPNTVYSSGSVQSSVAATVQYSTDNGQTWQSAELGDPTTVTNWLDQIQIGTPGAPQASHRLLYLRNVDQAMVALHLPYGGAWQAQSDVPWLFVPTSGAGATNLTVSSVNWDLAPGVYTGKVTIHAAGQTETISVQLTVTQTGAPATRLFLPLLTR